MAAKRVVSLGQEAFILSPEGKIVRTSQLEKEEIAKIPDDIPF